MSHIHSLILSALQDAGPAHRLPRARVGTLRGMPAVSPGEPYTEAERQASLASRVTVSLFEELLLAERALRAAKYRYEQGFILYLRVVNAERVVEQAEQAYLAAWGVR